MESVADGATELARRGLVRRSDLIAMGAQVPDGALRHGDWVIDDAAVSALAAQLVTAVATHAARHPLEPGMPQEAARRGVGLPEVRLLNLVIADPAASTLTLHEGRLYCGAARSELPEQLRDAVEQVRAQLSEHPFVAPGAHQLTALGLRPKQLAAADRAGELSKVADGIYLLPGAPERAKQLLAELPTPFTLRQVRQALGTTRRVAVPQLELLASTGRTRRHADGTHTVL